MKILVVFALEEEHVSLHLDGAEIVEIFTGVGKTQSATAVALAVTKHNPDLVLNIGTVGTYRHKVGDILVSRRFIDRDMQKLPMDLIKKDLDMQANSFGYGLKSIIDGTPSDHKVTINTGDNFVTCAEEDLGCDAVDMESFAVAWVCKQTEKPFLAVKYVTDVLGQNSISAWEEKLEHARLALQKYFDENGMRLLATC